MLIAGLGVVAALAFVLGLGAFCLWALKRWGRMSLSSRTRIVVEVVQRIPLGPKTGLAVVRVGDKVMALSVGEGGVRPLFEVDEADRLRIIASSQIPTPMTSSAEASSSLSRAVAAYSRQAAAPPTPVLDAPAPYAMTREQSATERDFRRMLGGALSAATRLAVFAGAMVMASAAVTSARAQAVPPVSVPPTTSVTLPTTTPTVSAPTSTAPALLPITAPAVAPPPAPPTGVPAVKTATPATVSPTVSASAQPKTATKKGNGTSVTAGGAASTRPLSKMQIDSAAIMMKGGRAAPAATAPVTGDDAVMRMMPQIDLKLGDQNDGGLRLNGTVGIVVMMGLLTLLPTLLLMMTGFTRILIVLHFLKQAMGTQSAPPAQLLGALALLLTGFVMAPTLTQVNERAITPWLDGKMTQVEMMKAGVVPMREFMYRQTRESDLKTFIEMSRLPRPSSADDVPLHVLMSAFVASELRTAFQIGFAIYLPFIIIDAVVASVLMSMGMFMLPPAMISLPFKLLLFVLVDGWTLTISSLVQSFK